MKERKTEVICSVVSILVYCNTFHADFVYDDNRAIVQNADVTKETPITSLLFNDFWGTPLNHSGSHGSYRPLTVLTFRLNYAMFNLQPSAYHVTNILLHSVTTNLLCRVLKSLLQLSTSKTLMTGLLFAVHPIHTEAVAGIVGRADILATLFCLATLLSYNKACISLDPLNANFLKESVSENDDPKVLPSHCHVQTLSQGKVKNSKRKKKKVFNKNKKSTRLKDSFKETEIQLTSRKENVSLGSKRTDLSNDFHGMKDEKFSIRPFHDSGSTSDDSHTTTDTYDNLQNADKSLNELDTYETSKLCDRENCPNGDNHSSGETIQNSCKENSPSVSAQSAFLNQNNHSKISDADLKKPGSDFTRAKSNDKSHSGYLWFLFSLLCAAAALLSKENGYCALPLCFVWDALIRHKLGFLGTLSALLTKEPNLNAFRRRACLVVVLTLTLVVLRVGIPIFLTSGSFTFPRFSPSDNPAAASEDFLTRTLTFHYLIFCNFQFLTFPATLNFDWSMDSIPLVTGFTDCRNVLTLLTYFVLYFVLKFIWRVVKSRDTDHFQAQTYTANASQGLSTLFHNCQSKHRRVSSSSESSWTEEINNNNKSTSKNKLQTPQQSWCSANGLSELHFQQHLSKDEVVTEDAAIFSVSVVILGMLPACNLLFYVGFVLAERILYLPSIGACLLLTESACFLIDVLYKTTLNEDLETEKDRLHSRNTQRNRSRKKTQVVFAKSICSMKHLVVKWGCLIIIFILFCSKTWVRNKDWENELTLYSSGVSINPAKSLTNLGNVLQSQGKVEDAEAAYTRALQHRSNMADVHYNLGLLYQSSNRNMMAEESYRRAIHFRPKLALAHLNLGVVLAEQHRIEEAKNVYRRTAELDNKDTKDPRSHAHAQISALYNLGNLFENERDYKNAVAVFKAAVIRPMNHYKPHSLYNMLGQSLFHLNETAEAEFWIKAALAAKVDHIPAYLTYARLLTRDGRLQQAESLYLQALVLESDKKTVYQHFGDFYFSIGEHLKAAETFSQIIEENLVKDDLDIIFSAARAFRQAKLYDKAERLYLKAVELAPKLAAAHMNLGAIFHLQKKYHHAKDSYVKALELEENKLILENLSKVERILQTL